MFRTRLARWTSGLGTAALLVVACTEPETPVGPEPEPPAAPAPPVTPFRISPAPDPVGFADSYGIWSPAGTDTCSEEIHDRYQTVGPDGLVYPTWHPPVDPETGCWFGHEHGTDPRTSDIYEEVGDIPFGYANQYLVASGFPGHRHEDHVGHKVEVINDLVMETDGEPLVCDILAKLHQGTHSPDAFTNNLHELAFHVRCSDGLGTSITVLAPIGTPGGFETCMEDEFIQVGPATPAQSPEGIGTRVIPTVRCALEALEEEFDLVVHETWETEVVVGEEDGPFFVDVGPYFQVFDPSRHYDPSQPRNLARSANLCSEGEDEFLEWCELYGTPGVAWDHPDTPFKGVLRGMDVNGIAVHNAEGPNIWYTDPFGRAYSTQPFPGSIRQWAAVTDTREREIDGGDSFRLIDHDAPGVRPIN